MEIGISSQPSPHCVTCMDLTFWPEMAQNRQIYGSEVDYQIFCEHDKLERSAATCAKCAILLEGINLATEMKLFDAGPRTHIVMRIGNGIALSRAGDQLIELFTLQETPETTTEAAFFPKRCQVAPIMNSRIAAQKAKHWLQTCLATHKSCRQAHNPNFFPKRVIRITSRKSDPQLYIPNPGQRGDYLALSYCWGINEPFLTTSDSLPSHIQGIPWAKIPNTMREAMLLALNLGVEFIWIDALCIIQDDPVDWEEQSLEMGGIYENALLTLSATSSDGTHTGLFHSQRNPQFKLSRRLPSLGDVDIYLREPCKLTHGIVFEGYYRPQLLSWPDRLARFPLLSRGWAFQERILSRRVLHVGPEELAWECLETVQCECASRAVSTAAPTLMLKKKRKVESQFRKTFTMVEDLRISHPLWEWETLVADYSTRDFTRHSDRLIALESTAQKFARLDMGSYYYGMWAKNLPIQLAWVAQYNDRRLDLPSWSWASIHGGCYFDPLPFLEDTQVTSVCEILEVPQVVSSMTKRGKELASIVIYGLAVDAKIALHKRVWKKPNDALEVKINIADKLLRKLTVDIRQYSQGTVEWENMQPEERLIHGEDVVCIQTATYSRPFENGIQEHRQWLVLRPSSQNGVYTHVGTSGNEEMVPDGEETLSSCQLFDQLAVKKVIRII